MRDHASTVDAAASLRSVGTHQSGGRRSRHQRGAAAGERRLLPRARRPSRRWAASFTEDEDRAGGPAVAVLSDRLWRDSLRRDASVFGTTVLLKGEPHLVVGVMPASFKSSVDADLWTPLRPSRTGEGGGQNYGIVDPAARRRDVDVRRRPTSQAAADPGLTRRTGDAGVSLDARHHADAAGSHRGGAASVADALGGGGARAARGLRQSRGPAAGARRPAQRARSPRGWPLAAIAAWWFGNC